MNTDVIKQWMRENYEKAIEPESGFLLGNRIAELACQTLQPEVFEKSFEADEIPDEYYACALDIMEEHWEGSLVSGA